MSARRNRTRSAARAGYTLVEVMVALAVLSVGVTGILSMQNAAIQANRRAQEMTIATNVARRWMERLRRDSLMWNTPSQSNPVSDLGRDTRYVCLLVGCAGGGGGGMGNQWLVPPTVGTAGVGDLESAAFDAFGNDVPIGSTSTRFCTNLRLNWLVAQANNRQGLIRAEVRVWWYREGATRNAAYANCGSGAALGTLGQDITTMHSVYVSTTVTGNPL